MSQKPASSRLPNVHPETPTTRADPHLGPSVMVDDLTRYEFEILSDDGDLALFRGRSRDGQPPILVRCPSSKSFTATMHERLSREYSLATEFDDAWAARPQVLREWAGRPALVLSDPGGSPLSSMQRESLDLEHFLKIAIAIARALRHLHNKGLIHRDLRPSNLLLDEEWRVWLTGFGVATTLPRERVAPVLVEGAADSLKYMAPERTGRMNRSVDHRADLYSFGVILYELLSGRLPYRAKEPIEWVHSHIARGRGFRRRGEATRIPYLRHVRRRQFSAATEWIVRGAAALRIDRMVHGGSSSLPQ